MSNSYFQTEGIFGPLGSHAIYISTNLVSLLFAINNLVSVQIGLFCRNRANEFVARGGQKISKLAIVNFALNSVEICLLCKSGNLGDSTGSAITNDHRFQRGSESIKDGQRSFTAPSSVQS